MIPAPVRRWASVIAFAGLAAGWEYGFTRYADAAGWEPIVAPASAAFLLAAFGWSARGDDAPATVGRAFLIAYAAWLGLACARTEHQSELLEMWHLDPLRERVAVVLLAGIAYALVLTVFVALPASLGARRRPHPSGRDDAFWSFIHDRAGR